MTQISGQGGSVTFSKNGAVVPITNFTMTVKMGGVVTCSFTPRMPPPILNKAAYAKRAFRSNRKVPEFHPLLQVCKLRD